jgi:hypothetical protein
MQARFVKLTENKNYHFMISFVKHGIKKDEEFPSYSSCSMWYARQNDCKRKKWYEHHHI